MTGEPSRWLHEKSQVEVASDVEIEFCQQFLSKIQLDHPVMCRPKLRPKAVWISPNLFGTTLLPLYWVTLAPSSTYFCPCRTDDGPSLFRLLVSPRAPRSVQPPASDLRQGSGIAGMFAKRLPLSGKCVSEEGRLLQPQKSERQLFGHHVLPLAGKLVLIIKQRCTVFHQV